MTTKRVRNIITAVIAFGVAVFVVWRLLVGAEPSYGGRSLSSWLKDFDRLGWNDTNAPAAQAVRAMGEGAIPYLVADILEERPVWGHGVRKRFRNGHFAWVAGTPPERTRARAAMALRMLGPDAAPALPLLMEEIKRGQGRYGAPWRGISAIVHNVDATIPMITNELSAPVYHLQAAVFLSSYVTNPKATVPYLMICAQDENPHARHQALIGLERFGPDARDAEAVVRALLDDPEPKVAVQAESALKAITGVDASHP